MEIANLHKLVTKEDPYHIHKGLGAFCFINFMYRYYLLFTQGSMFLNTNTGIASILLHGLLSLTSLIFHIPANRNPRSPMIYPEFRMHSIIFGLRSVLCCLTYYHDMHFSTRMLICYFTMFAADTISVHYSPENNGRTISNMPFHTNISNEHRLAVIHMNSCMQIGATTFMFGNIDSAFSPLFAIQIAAFLMTLVRKSIITCNMWHILYAFSLWINIFLYAHSLPFNYIIIQMLIYVLYTSVLFPARTNKYVNWTIMFLLYSIYQVYFADYIAAISFPEKYVRYTCILCFLGLQTYKVKGLFIKSN